MRFVVVVVVDVVGCYVVVFGGVCCLKVSDVPKCLPHSGPVGVVVPCNFSRLFVCVSIVGDFSSSFGLDLFVVFHKLFLCSLYCVSELVGNVG